MGGPPGSSAPVWGSHTPFPHSGVVVGPGPGSLSGQGLTLPSRGAQLQALPLSLPTPQREVPGNVTSVILRPLSSSTTYTVRVTYLYSGGSSSTMTGRLTTREWALGAVVRLGVPRLRCVPLPPWVIEMHTYT